MNPQPRGYPAKLTYNSSINKRIVTFIKYCPSLSVPESVTRIPKVYLYGFKILVQLPQVFQAKSMLGYDAPVHETRGYRYKQMDNF